MKLVSFFRTAPDSQPPEIRLGVLDAAGTAVLDLQRAADKHQAPRPAEMASMQAFLASWPASVETARDLLRQESTMRDEACWRTIGQVRLAAPLPVPTSIRDCMVFEQHLVQSMRSIVRERFAPLYWLDRLTRAMVGCRILRPPRVWFQRPLYYKGNCRSVVGPDVQIQWPRYSSRLDFELEFGVVIGRQGRNILRQDAADYIAGYTLFNDFSARDVQLNELRGYLGPAKSKDFDTGNAMGPFLVTPDEVGDIRQLTLTARVNGQQWTRASAASMQFSFPEIIAYVSEEETLFPGDFIGSGTLPGGCGLEVNRWLQDGDVVELDGGVLGILRNRVSRV